MKRILIALFLISASMVAAQESGVPVVVITPSGAAAGDTGETHYYCLRANGQKYEGFKAPDIITNSKIWTLPNGDGTNGQVMATNGAGILGWITPTGGGAVSPLVLTAHNDAEVPLTLNANSATQTADFLSAYDSAVAGNQIFGLNTQQGMFFYPQHFAPTPGISIFALDLRPSVASTVASQNNTLFSLFVDPNVLSTEAGSTIDRIEGIDIHALRDWGDADAGTVTNLIGGTFLYGNSFTNATAVATNVIGLDMWPSSQSGTTTSLIDLNIRAPIAGGTLTAHTAINQLDTAALCTNFLGAYTTFGNHTTWTGIAAPAVSPAGKGTIYFDSGTNKFRVSQNNGAYVDLIGGGGTGTVTSVATGNGLQGGPITTTGTIDLRLDVGGTLSKTLGAGSNELGIAALGVGTAQLAAASVTAAKMVNAGVFTGDATTTFPAITIGNGAITNAKIANTTIDLTAKVTGVLPPANGGTGVANAKNLTVSNALTLAGTDSTTMTFPTTSATIARTDAANTFTGHQTIEGVTSTGATGTGLLVFGSSPTLTTPVLTGLPTGSGVDSGATASTLSARDANANISANAFIPRYTTTATAAGTTTLTVGSTQYQFFTGSTTQTVVLPVTSTLVLGQYFWIVNNSTGVVTVQSSGANTVFALNGGESVRFVCILTSGTAAASWSASVVGATAQTGSGNLVFATSPTLTTPVLGTPSSGTLTSCTGLPEGGLSLTDITTNNVSATAHGFCPKFPNNTTTFLRGDGTYATVSASGGLPITSSGTGTPTILNSASSTITGLGNVVAYANTAAAATLTSGTGNTIVGNAADVGAATATNSVAIGNTTVAPTGGTVIGNAAGKASATAARLTAIGNTAGGAITTGSDDTFVGDQAGKLATTASGHTLIGSSAGAALAAAGGDTRDTFVGFNSGLVATGATNGQCTAVGAFALTGMTSGDKNTGLGFNCGAALTTGGFNTIIGNAANVGTSSDSNSVAVGNLAVTPSGGTVVGKSAGKAGATGTHFTAVGNTAGSGITSGADNCLFGDESGTAISGGTALTTGGTNSLFGSATAVNAAATANACVFGYASRAAASSVIIGVSKTSSTTNDLIIESGDVGERRVAPGVLMPTDGAGTGAWIQNPAGCKRVTTQVDVNNSTTLVNLSDLTWTLAAGRSYSFHIVLITSCNGGTGAKVDLGGGAATATTVNFTAMGGAASPQFANSTTLTGATVAQTTTFSQIVIDGTITVNAGGTFIPRFAANAAAAFNSSVLVGSYGWLMDMP